MSAATPFPWPNDIAGTNSGTNSGMRAEPSPAMSPETNPSTGAETAWRVLFRHAPMAAALCTGLGVITSSNAAFERLLGISEGSASGVPLGDLIQSSDFVTSQDKKDIDLLFREMTASQRESFQRETRMAAKTSAIPGTAAWVRWTVWKATSSERDSILIALVEDTTSGHHNVKPLRQAGSLEALGRLAGGVAHDFNNLLTGVTLYSDLLLAGMESGNRLRKYAEEISAASMQASGLVRQLLAVARTPNETPHLLSLNAVAEGMRQLLQRLIGENIELVYQLDPKLGPVRMDITQAQQILLNLVLNSRDALPEGGRITLETRNCGLQMVRGGVAEKSGPVELPCALFVVQDNGEGMDSQTQQHVFEAFFSTKPMGEGTGLGLSTVYDIVTSNGGLIHIDSEWKCGTRVTVLLPLVPLPQISPAELPKISPGDSQPQPHEGALLFSKEGLTP
jgi:PAS domain S-box-containing protein